MAPVVYALEQLYSDQDRDLVVDCVPAVLARVPGTSRGQRTQPFVFAITQKPGPSCELHLRWNLDALIQRDPSVQHRVKRMRSGRTGQREHVQELAGYGLAFVAISVLMPGRRVVGFNKGLPPDLVLDAAPDAGRGVEVAARTKGGLAVLEGVRRLKSPSLEARRDLVEVHLSLWCASPRVSLQCRVKP